ncbi:hypothetical protein O6H91_18G004400 [Diphasiastrum complanatum]|nr:hypothetical protein O6H91_18G004400 [Diphasiastrum complanatum]KAJ7522283.1 hypothetical protein O6H91_18G004400 [Diphasiastrum complanatum]KAJ7522284.1 hypothetical protein O6H91_18G004400 [Diphasiastrum complanatum]
MNTFCKRSCFCTASEVISLRTMANYTLGPVGGFLAALIYLLLSYTLLIAYIAKAGEVVPILVHLPASIAGILFTFGFGGFIYLGGREYAQHMNTVLTAALIGLFLFIVAEGAVVGDWENLHHMDWQRVPGSIPVVLLALVYHDIIPVLCRSLDGDLKRIQTAIVVGSAVPVVMFLSWDAVALCIAPVSDNEDPIATFMRLGGTGPALAIKLFSLLALATSFIGSYLGLFEFYLEQLSGLLNSNASSSRPVSFQRPLKQDSATFVLEENLAEQRTETLCISSNCEMAETVGIGYGSSMSPVVNEKTLHLISFFLILVPPLVAANGIPDAFFSATDFAGAYGMTTLYGIFPPIMALSLDNAATNSRDSDNHKSATGAQMLGGKASLIGIEVCALAVILGQVILDFSNL